VYDICISRQEAKHGNDLLLNVFMLGAKKWLITEGSPAIKNMPNPRNTNASNCTQHKTQCDWHQISLAAKQLIYRYSDIFIICTYLNWRRLMITYVKNLTSLQLCVRTMWWYQSSKTAKIIWVTLDWAMHMASLQEDFSW